MAEAEGPIRVVIVPGNGGGDVFQANWYAEMQAVLQRPSYGRGCIPVLQNMPDPHKAREKIWIPFMRKELGCNERTIIVGHSSGAVAAMRFAEQYQVYGIVLVSACHTDLGLKSERIAGYYGRPWLWERQKANSNWILQFHSDNDPFIPVEEARHVAANLDSEYYELAGKSHYFSYDSVQEVVHELRKKLTSAMPTIVGPASGGGGGGGGGGVVWCQHADCLEETETHFTSAGELAAHAAQQH
eukprot:gene3397-8434_t